MLLVATRRSAGDRRDFHGNADASPNRRRPNLRCANLGHPGRVSPGRGLPPGMIGPPVDQGLGQAGRQVVQDLAERTADLQAAEAANDALREVNAELRASRAALAASEARLRIALDAARMANWEWDAVGDHVTGSAGREALYGRPPGTLSTTPEVLGAVHPEDRERCAATILRAMGQQPGAEEFDAVEFRVLAPDGTVRWLRSQGRVTERDPLTGRALRAAGVTFDITRRREAETRYRVLFDSAPFTIIVIDPASYRILDVNAQACADYGYGREEFLQLTIADIDALGDAAAMRDRGRAHRIGSGAQEFEAQHRTRGGELRDVLVRVQGIDLGHGRVTYGAHVDITARKAAEAELRRSEERLRVAMTAGGLGAWETETATGLTRWDARLAAILGVVAEDGGLHAPGGPQPRQARLPRGGGDGRRLCRGIPRPPPGRGGALAAELGPDAAAGSGGQPAAGSGGQPAAGSG